MLLFAAIMILILWLIQIVFLEDFYKEIKIDDILSSGEVITESINNNDIDEIIVDISDNYEICVYIMDVQGKPLYSYDVLNNCIIHNMTYRDYSRLYNEAYTSESKQYLERYTIDANAMNEGRHPRARASNIPSMEGMIFASITTLSDGRDALILLNSVISPVEATINTLRVQLTYVTVIFLVLALLTAFIVSRIISKPIININSSAKELAKGNYDIKFNGQGYSEISELSDTLNYTAKELSKVDGLRKELIANVSHDLRTPLTMITGYSEVIRDIPGENTPENIQVIIDESNRLSILVNDLLDISKFESGVQVLNKEKFNLTLSIENIIKRYSKLISHNDYKINFENSSEIFVCADKSKIEQVVYNLINNAITYTGNDNKVVVKQTIKNDIVRIEIIDSGEGIKEEDLNNIWDRYYKVDKTHKRAQVGTGLGLSIVKNILDIHNGRYGVISKVNKGSNFWFELNIEEIVE